ncbi:alpha-crystallin A chain-like [Gigantopelta aegis]|uniref:alpha-crystallin A chain-like n=1 Tax=Gigantopelta aegis TaxID=1735272 RepID=UPI001B88B6DE|nr:alpha-crystallin A chain-like [Gigantopelta aegis]
MPFEHPVPVRREEWSFFDRQKSIFTSMHAGEEDLWKDFDQELEKLKKEMFQLTPMDAGALGSSMMPSLTGLNNTTGSSSGSPGSSKKVTSMSKTVTTKTTTTRTSGGKTDSSFESSFDSAFQTGMGSSALDSAFGSSMMPSLSSGMGSTDSLMLKVDKPFVTDMDGNKKLSLRFDCSKFKPEEISVKTLDNKLMVGAKHSEETATSKIYREFSKQYILPTKIDPLLLSSILAKDGVLSIEAPAPDAIEAPKERILPISRLAI